MIEEIFMLTIRNLHLSVGGGAMEGLASRKNLVRVGAWMAQLIRPSVGFPGFTTCMNKGKHHNKGQWKNFSDPFIWLSGRLKLTTHSHCPCSHWIKAKGPDAKMTAHERPQTNPPNSTPGPGTPAYRDPMPMSMSYFTFPKPGSSPSTICTTNTCS